METILSLIPLSKKVVVKDTTKRNIDKFNSDRQSEAASISIETDIQLAKKIGVSGTPFFVMNGETFSGAVKLSQIEETFAKVSQ